MRRKDCCKVSNGKWGMIYRFRYIGNYTLTWSFAHTEERSGSRVRKYHMETYKAHGRDLMTDDYGNGIHE